MKFLLLLLILAAIAAEILIRLHPAAAQRMQQNKSNRAFRFIIKYFAFAAAISLIVIGAIFGGIAIIQDIGTSSQGGCVSVNCQ